MATADATPPDDTRLPSPTAARPALPPARRPRRGSVLDGMPAGTGVVIDALAGTGLGLAAIVGLALLGLLLHLTGMPW